MNGKWKEEWVQGGWASLDSESAKETIEYLARVFPAALLSETHQLLREPYCMIFPSLTTLPMSRKRGRTGEYDLSNLDSLYRELLPIWQHAKVVYKANRSFTTWHETVKREIEEQLKTALIATADHPADDVLNDLVERLSDAPKLTEKQRASLGDRNLRAAPHDLALDHAARMCGVPLYHYSLRHLEKESAG